LTKALEPVMSRLDKVGAHLDKQDEFNREVSQRLTNLEIR
jgi:hypothetical protein